MLMEDGEDELTLRTHIRKLLLHYSLKHITTNYVVHTRSRVSELLSECLQAVPTADPSSLIIPVDPLDDLSRKLKLKELHPYEQKWEAIAESNIFIKSAIFPSACRPRTDECWEMDIEPFHFNPDRPMSPILTLRAMRQTPIPAIVSLPRSRLLSEGFGSHFMEQIRLENLPVELIQDAEITTFERDNLLGLRPKLDLETQQAISSFIRQVPTALPRSKTSRHESPTQEPRMVSTFLGGIDTPPVTVERLSTPPIFPRHINQADGLEKLSDISTLNFISKVKVEEDEVDMSAANMIIVDGWNAIRHLPASQGASPSTPSLEDGSGSSSAQNDELFALTPPGRSVFEMDPRMDEYLIPRNCKPNGGRSQSALGGESLAVFLPPLVPEAPLSLLSDRFENPSSHQGPLSPFLRSTCSSTTCLGNLSELSPSGFDTTESDARRAPALNSLIVGLCEPIKGLSPEDWILNEKMDEKEALMMEVPKLAEPNLHPLSPSCLKMPTSFRSLLALNRSSNNSTDHSDPYPTVACFKKVSGLQSLNIDLTWRPFSFGTAIPSTEELSDVEHLPTLGIATNEASDQHHEDESKLQGLLGGLDIFTDDQGIHRNNLHNSPVDWKNILGDFHTIEAILTRTERRRLAANDAEKDKVSDVRDPSHDSDSMTSDSRSGTIGSPSRPHKRRKTDLQVYSGPGPVDFLVPDNGSNASLTLALELELDTPSPACQASSSGQNRVTQMSRMAEPTYHASDVEKLRTEGDTTGTFNSYENDKPLKLGADESHMPSYSDSQGIIATHCPEILNCSLFPPAEVSPAPQAADMSQKSSLVSSRSRQQQVAHSPPFHAETASARNTLADFMTLRGRNFHQDESTYRLASPLPEPEDRISVPPSPPRGFPDELRDSDTLEIPTRWTAPTLRHKFIASLDFIQKRVLARNLSSTDCNVELVERETSGVDIITDIDTAVLFVPLAPLPTTCETLATKITELSWSFSRLVIVFEGFFSSLSYRSAKEEAGKTDLSPYAYSPPVVKSIKRLKRILKISAAMEASDSRGTSTIWYAYANDPGEAARIARLVGDMPVADGKGLHEDDRAWLTDDFSEDEMDLSGVKGMNAFAASIILKCMDLDTFLTLDPSNRLQIFADMVGERRMLTFNEEVEKRLANVTISALPPLSPDAQTTISSSKPFVEHFEDVEYGDDLYIGEMHGDYSPGVDDRYGDVMDWQSTGLLAISGNECGNHLN